MKNMVLPAVAFLAGGLLAPLRSQEPRPTPPAGEGLERRFTEEELERYTPREALRRRLENEVLGVWKILDGKNPEIDTQSPIQGYFVFHGGYVGYTLVTTAKDRVIGQEWNLFQSGVKRYRVTEGGGLLLQGVLGVSNLGGPSTTGPQPLEEREILFEMDTMRISRALDDYLVLQRVPTEAPEPILPAPRKRVLIPPTPTEPTPSRPGEVKKPG
jgi:hypothetical protein